jgi:hypothetical protein
MRPRSYILFACFIANVAVALGRPNIVYYEEKILKAV